MATVRSLLNSAVYLSTLRDRQFNRIEQNGGDYICVALELFNEILNEQRYNIPFVQEITFTSYNSLQNTKFVDVVQLYYTIGNVKYPVKRVGLNEYNRKSVVVGLRTLPLFFWFDKLTQSVKVYPLPLEPDIDKFIVYAFTELKSDSLDIELPTNMPGFMATYIKYELARRIAEDSNLPFSDDKKETLETLLVKVETFKSRDISQEDRAVMNNNNTSGKGTFPFFWYISGGTL